MLKPISTALSPNTEKDDVRLACKLKLRPWFWKKREAVEKLEREFREFLLKDDWDAMNAPTE